MARELLFECSLQCILTVTTACESQSDMSHVSSCYSLNWQCAHLHASIFFFSINVGLVMSSSVKRKQKTVTQIPSETKATKKKIPQATQNPN